MTRRLLHPQQYPSISLGQVTTDNVKPVCSSKKHRSLVSVTAPPLWHSTQCKSQHCSSSMCSWHGIMRKLLGSVKLTCINLRSFSKTMLGIQISLQRESISLHLCWEKAGILSWKLLCSGLVLEVIMDRIDIPIYLSLLAKPNPSALTLYITMAFKLQVTEFLKVWHLLIQYLLIS